MAQIIINIPDNHVSRVRDAFAQEYDWSGDMGVTKTQFAKDQIVKFIKQTVNNAESRTQLEQVRQTIKVDVENITIN